MSSRSWASKDSSKPALEPERKGSAFAPRGFATRPKEAAAAEEASAGDLYDAYLVQRRAYLRAATHAEVERSVASEAVREKSVEGGAAVVDAHQEARAEALSGGSKPQPGAGVAQAKRVAAGEGRADLFDEHLRQREGHVAQRMGQVGAPVQRQLIVGEITYEEGNDIPDDIAQAIEDRYDVDGATYESGEIIRTIYFYINHGDTFGRFENWPEVFDYAELQLEIEGDLYQELGTEKGLVDNDVGSAEEKLQFLQIMNEEKLFKIVGLKKKDSEQAIIKALPEYYTALEGHRLKNLAAVWREFAAMIEEIMAKAMGTKNPLEQADFQGIKEAGDYILHRYPPGKFEYIGLGASPLPIMVYLEMHGINWFDVPISGMSGSDIKGIWNQEPNKKAALIKFLDQHLDGIDFNKGMLILDYSSGGTLYVAEFIIGSYLHEKMGYDRKGVVPLSLREADKTAFIGSVEDPSSSNITSIESHTDAIQRLGPLLNSALYKDMGYRRWDKKPLYDVLQGSQELEEVIGGYERLRKDLGAFMGSQD